MAGVVFTKDGIEEVQNFIRTGSGTGPVGSFFFGEDTGSINTSRTLDNIDTVYLQKEITWEKAGDNSKFSVGLTSLELNGSYINRGGLTNGSVSVGSLITVEESIVGSKTSSFTVEIVGEVTVTPLN